MKCKIGDKVCTLGNNLTVLKGVVREVSYDSLGQKYYVHFEKPIATTDLIAERDLFGSEEECLQHEYDREKAYIDSALTYLNQVKEKLDKIKGATCRNCINFCPTCKRCKATHPAIAEDMIDRVDLIKCYFYKRKGN
jgi:hypothetical protein